MNVKPILTAILILLLIQVARADAASATIPSIIAPTKIMPPDSAWFDADTDSIVPIEIKNSRPQAENRDSRWTPENRKKKSKKPNAANANQNSGGWFDGWFSNGVGSPWGGQFSFWNIVGWIVLLLLVGVLSTLMVKTLSKYKPASRKSVSTSSLIAGLPDQQTIQRMAELPAAVRRTDVNLREETERLMQVGNFNDATVTLFGHQLLLLDRMGWLRLARGKTNQRYVREVRLSDQPTSKILAQTVASFDRGYFGNHNIDGVTFEDLWRQNADLERQLQHSHRPTIHAGAANQ